MRLENISIIEWIQIISGLGTLGAALAAWITARASNKSAKTAEKQLDEMKEQRVKMYQPSLVFTNNIYKVTAKESNKVGPMLSMFNVGYGVAKDIIIKWEEPDYLDYNSKPFISTDGDFWRVSVPFKGDNHEMIINKNFDYEQKIQHLLPTSVDNKAEEVDIPTIPTYSLLQLIYNELINNKNPTTIMMYQLRFTVIYRDINNEEHKEKHSVELSFLSYVATEEPELTIKIEVTE
ncbi:hypothetical protein ACTWP4_18725 [Gracilibacillus sp. D59]|uniref:hypothetical protein n=1 Tax=Gracilibacillus sp. D59 TaxID=3457434 RepID=UPI003FCED735